MYNNDSRHETNCFLLQFPLCEKLKDKRGQWRAWRSCLWTWDDIAKGGHPEMISEIFL